MALELKTALEAAGLPTEIDSPEALVEAINKKFIVRDEAVKDAELEKKFYGKFANVHESALRKAFDLEETEIVGKPLKDVIKLSAEKVAQKMKEIEEAGGKGNDEKLNKLLEEHNKLKAQITDLSVVNTKLIQEKDQLASEYDGKIKSFKIDSEYKKAKAKLAFADGIPNAAKVGFDTIFNGKYKIDFDEKGATIVTDHEGKPIANPKKTGVYLGLEEVLDQELDAQSLKKKNNLPANPPKPGPVSPQDADKQRRPVNPAALANAERLGGRV